MATSMLYSCFESWLVSEHICRYRFSNGLLSHMFGLMYSVMYGVAICSGLLAQLVADAVPMRPYPTTDSLFHVGGLCSPFDLAICCLVVGMIAIMSLWKENHGASVNDFSGDRPLYVNLQNTIRVLKTDKRCLFLCVIVSCFEGSMFAFVFNWTPALSSTAVPPLHGTIFALFMMACMCGASTATIVGDSITATRKLLYVMFLSVLAMAVVAHVVGSEERVMVCFVAFLVFEFCCGVYFPTISVLKSEVVPEEVRATMYNAYRVPMNGLVMVLLLGNIPTHYVFVVCAFLLGGASIAVAAVDSFQRKQKKPQQSSTVSSTSLTNSEVSRAAFSKHA